MNQRRPIYTVYDNDAYIAYLDEHLQISDIEMTPGNGNRQPVSLTVDDLPPEVFNQLEDMRIRRNKKAELEDPLQELLE